MSPSALGAAWRPAALIYLACCLAGLLAGLYPEAVYPSHRDVIAAPVPALQALATAQVLAGLLIYPLVVLRRAERGRIGRYWAEAAVESLAWLAVTAPMYLLAAYLADAVAVDVLRTILCVLAIWSVGWSAGAALAWWPAARPAVALLLLLAVSLPAVYYLFREFLRALPADWLWDLAPATFAWQAAESRAGILLPRPLWALAAWPAAAVALTAARLLARSASHRRACSRQPPGPQGTQRG